jgi:hypothetical protein
MILTRAGMVLRLSMMEASLDPGETARRSTGIKADGFYFLTAIASHCSGRTYSSALRRRWRL